MNPLTLLCNVSIRNKLLIIGGVLIAAMLLSSGYAILKMNHIGTEIVAIAEEDIPLTRVITELTINQLEQAINFERAVRFGEAMHENPADTKHFANATSKFEKYNTLINKEIKQGTELAKQVAEHAQTPAQHDEFVSIAKRLATIHNKHKSFEDHVHQVFKLLKGNKLHKVHTLAEKIEKEEDAFNHSLEDMLREIEDFTEHAALTAEKDEQHALKVMIFIAISGIIFASLLGLVVVRNISGNLQQAIRVTHTIASGDLSQDIEVNSGDEIGAMLKALKTMRNNLHDMVQEMDMASGELASTSEELATVSEQSNANVQNQQAEVDQVATAMNEMAATIQEVAKNAVDTSTAANSANEESNTGQRTVQATISAINDLSTGVNDAANVIAELEKDSQSIGSVLDVIKGIAEQTNLLALNAAIEAARAGEQGRGFAVVADEVRTLAQRTQQSTEEIEQMIQRLQSSTHKAVNSMDKGRELAGHSVEQAADAEHSLETIIRSVALISNMNAQIANAAEEQASVAEEMNCNLSRVSTINEQNAAAANETTASSENLARQANNLQLLIQKFKV